MDHKAIRKQDFVTTQGRDDGREDESSSNSSGEKRQYHIPAVI